MVRLGEAGFGMVLQGKARHGEVGYGGEWRRSGKERRGSLNIRDSERIYILVKARSSLVCFGVDWLVEARQDYLIKRECGVKDARQCQLLMYVLLSYEVQFLVFPIKEVFKNVGHE